MSELDDAIIHMAQTQEMVGLHVWFNVTKDGKHVWLCSCNITTFSCFVSEGADPISAMLDAMRQAWQANNIA